MQFQEPWIVWLQTNFHPALDPFFKTITLLGGFEGIVLLWCFFIWCISYSYGCRLILLTQPVQYLSSLWIKALVALPRPYQAFSSVIGILPDKGFSFPSGHALNGMLYWGFLARFIRNRWVTTISILFILLIGLSRIYLGVHYPTDVLGGYIIGLGSLWIFFKINARLEQFFERSRLPAIIGIIFGVVTILWLLLVLFGPPGIPVSWEISALGLTLGICFGWLAKKRWLAFEADGPWVKRIARFLLGSAILYGALYFCPKTPWMQLFSGLWLSFGGPALFQIIGLGKTEKTQ